MIVLGYVYRHVGMMKVLSVVASSVTICGITCNEMGKSLKETLNKLKSENEDLYGEPITITVADGFEDAGSVISFDDFYDLKYHKFVHTATNAVLTNAGYCGWGILVGSTKGRDDIEVSQQKVNAASDCMQDLVRKGYWRAVVLKVHLDCCS